MTQTEEKPKPQPIRDAATLILFRHTHGQIEVLMGERHGGNAFMPGQFVFPGGKLDPNDYRIRPAYPLSAVSVARFARAPRTGPRKALGLALAAIRETYEETGLRIAGPAPPKAAPAPKGWRGFCSEGALAPDPSRLIYVFRAITPAGRPRRFDARFFIAPAEAATGELTPSEELGKLHWVTLPATEKLQLPDITKLVLKHLPEWVTPAALNDPDLLLPFSRGRIGKRVVSLV